MRQFLSPQTIEFVRRLLDAGIRQVRVARHLGLSRAAVNRLARRFEGEAASGDSPAAPPRSPARRRCPECGGIPVEWPCRPCALRALLAHVASRGRSPRRAS